MQFLVTWHYHEPILKNVQEFADRLAVHVNHLNCSAKEVIGKPITAYIADRYLSEAKVLLQQTDWSGSEIADSLGFEYATYFQRFFQKAYRHHAASIPPRGLEKLQAYYHIFYLQVPIQPK